MLSPADQKKFAKILARFRDMASRHHVEIENGDFMKMVWAGIVPELLWVADELIKVHGDPGTPNEAAPIPTTKKVKKASMKKGRLARVQANEKAFGSDEFAVDATEAEEL